MFTSPAEVPSEAWPSGPGFGSAEEGAAKVLWPTAGQITFDAVEMRYRPHLPLVLQDLSFEIQGGERVGCIGRTGSGKSSLLVVLFRIVEPSAGKVLVDGVDIAQVGLHRLRSSLSMIPQTPILFEGTVRLNLDPFGKSSGDAALASALRRAELGNLSLDAHVGGGGGSLSMGERQLLSFARCLLQNRKVVVLDEPTASVDLETDVKLQKLVRSAFRRCTLLCIAHRLQTVIDFDRLLVMNAGEKQALDTPKALLADLDSPLSRIVDGGTGHLRAELERLLADAANKAYVEDGQDQSDLEAIMLEELEAFEPPKRARHSAAAACCPLLSLLR